MSLHDFNKNDSQLLPHVNIELQTNYNSYSFQIEQQSSAYSNIENNGTYNLLVNTNNFKIYKQDLIVVYVYTTNGKYKLINSETNSNYRIRRIEFTNGTNIIARLHLQYINEYKRSNIFEFQTVKNNIHATRFTVPSNVPSKLYYFSENSMNMGGELNISTHSSGDKNSYIFTKKQYNRVNGFKQISSYVYRFTVPIDSPNMLYLFSASTKGTRTQNLSIV